MQNKKIRSKNVQIADNFWAFMRARAFPPIAVPFDAPMKLLLIIQIRENPDNRVYRMKRCLVCMQ
jgi:hypothetical protein